VLDADLAQNALRLAISINFMVSSQLLGELQL
jgi:hypothetical protein